MLRIALPSFVGLVATQSCNILVQIFVGRYVGDGALTAVSNFLPTEQFFFANVMTSIGTGAAALMSNALGNHDIPQATIVQGQLFVITLVVGLLLSIIFLPWLPTYLQLLGTTKTTLQDCLNYAYIGAAFLPCCYAVNMGLSNVFRCFNKADIVMWRQIAMCILSISLNGVFVVWLRLGTRGAAIAAVCAYFIPGVFIVYYFCSRKATIPLKCSHFKLQFRIIWKILALGSSTLGNYIPQALQSLLSPVLLKLFAESEDRAKQLQMIAGITSSIVRMFTLPLSGLVFGVPPLLGYALGANDKIRVRSVIKASYSIIFGIAIPLFVLIVVFSPQIVQLFSRSTEIYAEASLLLRISISGILLNNFVFLATTILQQEQKAWQALVMQLIRAAAAIFVQVCLPWITHKPELLFLGQPVGDVIGGLMGFVYMLVFFKRYGVCCENKAVKQVAKIAELQETLVV